MFNYTFTPMFDLENIQLMIKLVYFPFSFKKKNNKGNSFHIIVILISCVILLVHGASLIFLISSTEPGKVLLFLLCQLQLPGQERLGVRGREGKSVLGGM